MASNHIPPLSPTIRADHRHTRTATDFYWQIIWFDFRSHCERRGTITNCTLCVVVVVVSLCVYLFVAITHVELREHYRKPSRLFGHYLVVIRFNGNSGFELSGREGLNALSLESRSFQ